MANSRLCSIPDCGKPLTARGYCGAHYRRMLKHGDPFGGRTPEGEPLARIKSAVLTHNNNECIFWPYGGTNGGYGTLSYNGKRVLAHRLVCELVNGPAPTDEHQAAHSCGNGYRGCYSPMHLQWKTRTENAQDRVGHGTAPRGEQCGTSKLTVKDVTEIRELSSEKSYADLAAMFGVSRPQISLIARRKSWAWLP